jgi:hypothetical protein
MHILESIKLEVSKAIEQLAFIDRSYNLGLWPSDASKHDWKHDLAIMRAFDDLEYICLELLAADNTVLGEFRPAFNGSMRGLRVIDSARGVELPILNRRLISGQRALLQRRGHEAQYRHLLRIPWSPAETLRKRAGDVYKSEPASATTAGRLNGAIHVGAEARHRLVVTQIGTKGYAFARDLDLGADGIFLHPKFAPVGMQFRIGQRLTSVIVQTPRGLQARNIQAA